MVSVGENPARIAMSVGEKYAMVVMLTCSIHMTIYYYADNASIIPAPSESYFA
jgi:hypothetical protein